MKLEVNGFTVEDIEPGIPGKPFEKDQYHMGFTFGTNVEVMYSKFNNQFQPYLIIVDIDTGHRVRISLPKKAAHS